MEISVFHLKFVDGMLVLWSTLHIQLFYVRYMLYCLEAVSGLHNSY